MQSAFGVRRTDRQENKGPSHIQTSRQAGMQAGRQAMWNLGRRRQRWREGMSALSPPTLPPVTPLAPPPSHSHSSHTYHPPAPHTPPNHSRLILPLLPVTHVPLSLPFPLLHSTCPSTLSLSLQSHFSPSGATLHLATPVSSLSFQLRLLLSLHFTSNHSLLLPLHPLTFPPVTSPDPASSSPFKSPVFPLSLPPSLLLTLRAPKSSFHSMLFFPLKRRVIFRYQ